MKLTRGKLVAVIAVAAGVMAVALTVTRNMMLDSATLQMKTGEFDRAATKALAVEVVRTTAAGGLLQWIL